jgi:hypothetical protein
MFATSKGTLVAYPVTMSAREKLRTNLRERIVTLVAISLTLVRTARWVVELGTAAMSGRRGRAI